MSSDDSVIIKPDDKSLFTFLDPDTEEIGNSNLLRPTVFFLLDYSESLYLTHSHLILIFFNYDLSYVGRGIWTPELKEHWLATTSLEKQVLAGQLHSVSVWTSKHHTRLGYPDYLHIDLSIHYLIKLLLLRI